MADEIKIETPALKVKEAEQTEEARRLWNQKVAAQEAEQRVLTLKAQQQYYDNFAALFSEGISLIKELRGPFIEFYKSASGENAEKILKQMEAAIDTRIVKVLVAGELLPPQALDALNRTQGRQNAAAGQPQQEIDVGGKVLADFNGMDIG